MKRMPEKGDDSTLDYLFNFQEWLGEGETITEYDVTATEGIEITETSQADGIVTVWLKGGTPNQTYRVHCTITTDNTPPRIDERTMIIKVVAER